MDDIQLLATILQGEAAVLGPAGMTAVAAVFIARLLSPAYPSTVSAVAPPFYGRADPSPIALDIAEQALAHPQQLLALFGTHMFVFSAQDRHRLHLPPGDRQFIRSDTWQLHLYQEDPLEHRPTHPSAPIPSALPGTAEHTRQVHLVR